jgi:hypothetical protein
MNCWAHTEDATRYDKARKLAKLIIEFRISTEDAKRMTGEQWGKLSIAAAVPKPSTPTRELTLDLVELARTPVVAHVG